MTKWLAKALKVDISVDVEQLYSATDISLNLYDEMNFIGERFNVRGLPYAFTARSPLMPVFRELADREENADEGMFTVIASDSSLGGPDSIFILHVFFGEDDEQVAGQLAINHSSLLTRAASTGEGVPVTFTTPLVTTPGGPSFMVSGIHAVSARMLADGEMT